MNDLDRLTRAVLDDPADDLPRLVLADWFEENSTCFENRVIRDPLAYAKFIRLQIEIHRVQSGYELDPAYERKMDERSPIRTMCINEHWEARRLFRETGLDDPNWNNIVRLHATWQRGMPYRVTDARVIRNEKHLKDLFLNWPITEFYFGHSIGPGRYRYKGVHYWRWYTDRLIDLPFRSLFERSFLSKRYTTHELAYYALSDELVRIGRELAGLPVLHTLTYPAESHQ